MVTERRIGMNSKELLNKVRNLSTQEQRNLSYEELVEMMNVLTPEEIVTLSNIIGYPVFTRLCMGDLKHKFVLLQDGAAAIIVNKEGQVLLQSRACLLYTSDAADDNVCV